MVMEVRAPNRSAGLNVQTSPEYKLIVVGPRQVGKSALVVRFLTKRFISEYLENTEMTCGGKVRVDGETLLVNVQDSSEKSMRSASLDHYCRWADAIMLVFSLTDPASFEQLQALINRMIQRKGDRFDTPVVLVGNKCDLELTRKVGRARALELAGSLRCDYYECSAREGSVSLVPSADQPSMTSSSSPSSHAHQESRERKRSNSADHASVAAATLGLDSALGGSRGGLERPLKRWSSQKALNRNGQAAHSDSDLLSDAAGAAASPSGANKHGGKNHSRRAMKLLRAAGRLSPMLARRITHQADKKRQGRQQDVNMNNSNNNAIAEKPKTIPGLVVNSLRLTGSVCSIGAGRGDLLGVPDLDFLDHLTPDDPSASSSTTSSLSQSSDDFCAAPFVQLCREAKKRRIRQVSPSSPPPSNPFLCRPHPHHHHHHHQPIAAPHQYGNTLSLIT